MQDAPDTPLNLEVSDLKDIDGESVQKAKKGGNIGAAFNISSRRSRGGPVFELKPVIQSKRPRQIRHIDLALKPAFLPAAGLKKESAKNTRPLFPFKERKWYQLWYRIYDDSGNLKSTWETEKFQFNIHAERIVRQPIDFAADYSKVIEGAIFQTGPRSTESLTVKIYYMGKAAPGHKLFIFPGFRIRVYFEPLSRETIVGYDAWNKDFAPEFDYSGS